MRLAADAAGWTPGPHFESPDLVPTRIESHPFDPRSSRWRCHLAFAIPEPARPLFVQGSLGIRLSRYVISSLSTHFALLRHLSLRCTRRSIGRDGPCTKRP